jgi:hypothetical protein
MAMYFDLARSFITKFNRYHFTVWCEQLPKGLLKIKGFGSKSDLSPDDLRHIVEDALSEIDRAGGSLPLYR